MIISNKSNDEEDILPKFPDPRKHLIGFFMHISKYKQKKISLSPCALNKKLNKKTIISY
jgi:hypothetical protein